MPQPNVRRILEVIAPFARMAEGRATWDDDAGCAVFPTMAQVRAARDLWFQLDIPATEEIAPLLTSNGRYIHLPPVNNTPKALAVTATRLAFFAMKMATGYTPDSGDPRLTTIYRQVLEALHDTQRQRPEAGQPIEQVAKEIVDAVDSVLPVDGWRLANDGSDYAEAREKVAAILRKNPPPVEE